MTINDLRELLEDLPSNAVIKMIDESPSTPRVFDIVDAGWDQSLGHYVIRVDELT